jgi:hypothetical protein
VTDVTQARTSGGADARTPRLLRGFDRRAARRRRLLAGRLGDGDADSVLREARRAFEELCGEIPYAGRESNPMARNIVVPYEQLALSLELRRRGLSVEDIGRFLLDSEEGGGPPAGRMPGWLVRLAIRLAGPLLLRPMRRAADESQRREHPDEFVFAMVKPDDETAFGFDIIECAVCKAFAKHGALDIVPWICALDDKGSDALGLGLRRSGTIALGADRCDFRYKPGGEPRSLPSPGERVDAGADRQGHAVRDH